MINYKFLDGRKICTYDKLTIDAKNNAQKEMKEIDLKYFNIELNNVKMNLKRDVQSCINNNKTKFLISKKAHIKRLNSDLNFLERYIIQNQCYFTENGEYVSFC
jgi:hypothetical protein